MSRRVLLLSLVTGFCAAAMVAQTCPPGASWCSGLYRYDGMGNIRAIGNDTYIYDTAGRLVSGTAEVQRGGTSRQDYAYDTFGNRTGASRIPGSVDCLGGCEQSPAIDPATNHIISNGAQYDAAGNLIAIQNTVNGVTYSASYVYDSVGRLARATVGSDDRQFIYTADDERIATRNGQNWTWTVRDLDNKVLREFTSLEPNGQPGLPTLHRQWAKDYIWRDGLLLASVAPTTPGASTTLTQHFHLDHLGTPRLVSNDAGVQIGIHAYYPFGAELNLSPNEQPGELMKFTGHERDVLASNPNTLDYMHARYYNATAGRFLSVDPKLDLEKTVQTPQWWNRYTYALNNPLRYTDPDGREVTITIKRDTYTSESVTATIEVTSDVKGVNGFSGFTLETTHAGDKGDKDPISAGTYDASVRTDHTPNRVELQNVPGFDSVQIHVGNTKDDVKGCFAVGTTRTTDNVSDSKSAMTSVLAVISNDKSGVIKVTVEGSPTKPPPTPPVKPPVKP